MSLADAFRSMQSGHDPTFASRLAICSACEYSEPELLRREGRIKCALCKCGDPARTREQCPDDPPRWGDKSPVGFKGRITVVLPARNEASPLHEGNKLLNTIEALRESKSDGTDLHFAAFDDNSHDGCATPLRDMADVTLYRNAHALGQGINRNLGVWMNPGARGYVQMDAHMDIQKHGLETLVLDAEATGGFVGALSRDLKKPDQNSRRAGNNWAIQGEGESLDLGCFHRKGIGITWKYAKRGCPRLLEVPIQRGACTAFTWETFKKFGGYGESYTPYSFADHDLAIRARFLGIPSHVNTTVIAWHWYRVLRTYPQSGCYMWWGYAECLRAMFRPDVWESVFLPSARKAAYVSGDAMLEYLIRSPRIQAMQAAFEPLKERTDEQVLDWMGIAHGP